MRGKVKIKNKRISKIASKTILILIAILTILAFCAGEYEKMQAAPNLIRANANSTAESDTSQGNTSSDTNNGEKPITLDQNQLESLDDYISNNKQNPDSETPKEEQTTEDGLQPDEENQEINEQNAEENSDVNAISDDATANEDEGIALLSSESKGEANVSWKSQIKGEYWNKINKIIATDDGGAIAVGWIYQESTNPTITTNGNKDALIIKYDSKGKIEWFKNYGGSGDDEFTDIVQASNGRYAVIGNSRSAEWNNNGIVFNDTSGYQYGVAIQLNDSGYFYNGSKIDGNGVNMSSLKINGDGLPYAVVSYNQLQNFESTPIARAAMPNDNKGRSRACFIFSS